MFTVTIEIFPRETCYYYLPYTLLKITLIMLCILLDEMKSKSLYLALFLSCVLEIIELSFIMIYYLLTTHFYCESIRKLFNGCQASCECLRFMMIIGFLLELIKYPENFSTYSGLLAFYSLIIGVLKGSLLILVAFSYFFYTRRAILAFEASQTPSISSSELEQFLTTEVQINSVCSICLSKCKETQEVLKLECSHYFHMRCMEHWTALKGICPLCRRGLLEQ